MGGRLLSCGWMGDMHSVPGRVPEKLTLGWRVLCLNYVGSVPQITAQGREGAGLGRKRSWAGM
jgi:hypothetical protein